MPTTAARWKVSSRRAGRRGAVTVGLVSALALTGCVAPARVAREIEDAARPLLELDPDANWTACYNRLLELAPGSIEYVATRPVMQRRAAPDDLRVMLHTSLLRLLADPVTAPRLSANCFETTLDVLHFDPKVCGRSPGTVHLPTAHVPRAWHELYPADFDHELAACVDPEADRQLMLRWWRQWRGAPARPTARRPLRPRAEHLWAVLSRRYADLWQYEVGPEVVLCAGQPGSAALFCEPAYEYNLVRAVCIWLGSQSDRGTESRLIALVGHPAPIVAYNARFALRYSPDRRIRQVIERYKDAGVQPGGARAPEPILTAVHGQSPALPGGPQAARGSALP